MHKYLAITLATRGRPELLPQTIEQTLSNIVRPTTTLMIAVDDDDEPTIEIVQKYRDHCAISIAPREDTLPGKFDRVRHVAMGDIYLMMVDYAPMMIAGFDQHIIDRANSTMDGYSIIYGPAANLSFPQTLAVSAKVAEKIGGVAGPAYFPYWFWDHWVDDIARMIGRVGHGPLMIADCQSRRPNKTLELRETAFWGTFYDETYPIRARQALNIINSSDFEETQKKKQWLIDKFYETFERSKSINDNCRSMENAMEQSRGGFAPDDRYARIKAGALKILENLPTLQTALEAA